MRSLRSSLDRGDTGVECNTRTDRELRPFRPRTEKGSFRAPGHGQAVR